MHSAKNTTTAHIFQSDLSMPHDYVKNSVEFEYGHHRTEWMKKKLTIITSFFTETIGTAFTPLILTNTRKGALEAVITNLRQHFPVIAAQPKSNWSEVLSALNIPYQEIDLHSHRFTDKKTLVLLEDTYCAADITKQINTYKKSNTVTIILDAANSFGTREISWNTLCVDGYVISPERALGSITGMSILALKERLIHTISSTKPKERKCSYSLDLNKYYESWKKQDTPYSPDISSLVALSASIELMQENGGFTNHIKRQQKTAELIRDIFAHDSLPITVTANQATKITLPPSLSAETIYKKLAVEKNIYIDACDPQENSLQIGHVGYITFTEIEYLRKSLVELIGIKDIPLHNSLPLIKAPLPFLANQPLFEINQTEFMHQAQLKAASADSTLSQKKILNSAQHFFQNAYPKEAFVYTNRTIGFIGAGNTVKETIIRCKEVGIHNIMAYSPSLAKAISCKETSIIDNFWNDHNVQLCTKAEDVFLKSHTVILLPTYYDEQGVKLCGKELVYLNQKQIDEKLLSKIRDVGKMDLLINASARSEIIDRQALRNHLDEGWLRFVSDETPTEFDPVTRSKGTMMTGHIGGSSDITKEKIAINTNKVLQHLVCELTRNDSKTPSDYHINLVNEHLQPKNGWRSANTNTTQELKILLTDIFDIAKINFKQIESNLGVTFTIVDMKNEITNESDLIEAIKKHQPNILMIRTKTTITEAVARELSNVTDFYYLLRPGVGIDNIYPGMRILSSHGVKIINEPHGNSSSVGEMTTRFILRSTPKIILTPGPTPHNQQVFHATQDYTSYKSELFSTAYRYVTDEIASWINLDYGPIITSSPSTGLMEAAITNLTTTNQHGLVISHGKFGNRFMDIGLQNNRIIHSLQVDDAVWGEAYTVEKIKNKITALHSEGITLSFVCLQQNETSSGVAYKQPQLQEIVHEIRSVYAEIIIIVDVVSGLFSHRLDFSTLDIDMAITGSQKGLGVTSGISYAMMSKRAISMLLQSLEYQKTWEEFCKEKNTDSLLTSFENKKNVYYFSIPRVLIEQFRNQYDRPVSIFHILSTRNSLQLLKNKTKESVANHSLQLAEMCRDAFTQLGLTLPVTEPFRSATVTPVFLPKHIDAPTFRKNMEETYGIIIAGAQNETLKPKLLRIGHTGYVNTEDTVKLIRSFKILLKDYAI